MENLEVQREIPPSEGKLESGGCCEKEDKSWYIFSILVKLGRPSSPEEISENCSLLSISPSEVESLCIISQSPLRITEGRLVTCSEFSVSLFNKLSDKFAPDSKSEENAELVPFKSSRKRLGEELLDADAGVRKSTKVPKSQAHVFINNHILPESLPSGVQHCFGQSKQSVANIEAANGGVQVQTDGICIQETCQNVLDNLGGNDCHASCAKLPEDHEGKDDCALTYKRRRGEAFANQPGCVNKEGLIHQLGYINPEGILPPDSLKADVKICPPTASVQTSGKLDGTATVRSEEVKCRADEAIVERDLAMSLQACTSSVDMNPLAKGECPAQAQMTDRCISHGTQNKSVVENIIKHDDGECSIQKGDLNLKPKLPCKKLDACQTDNKTKIREVPASLEKVNVTKERTKIKKNGKVHALVKDGMNAAGPVTTKSGGESKRIPLFESFTVEEEEGSGGYGTVYKARRKQDGKIFAIKCPLEKTPFHYVNNEMKMLERFGGRPFIIKYEGVFKDNGCDCLILEHVEHEKPEVLRREIDVSQLRWYGYCMFKALSILHKNGVIHRDVKPGNFLFCRKLNEGYLIDFNLALEQHALNATGIKPKMLSHGQRNVLGVATQKPPVFNRKGIPSNSVNSRQKTLLAAAAVSSQTKDAVSFTKKTREVYSKQTGNTVNVKKVMSTTQAKLADLGNHKAHRNFSPDVRDAKPKLDGVIAAKIPSFSLLVSPSKEITSARTPSGGERLREPLPSQGRKELISFAQETRHSPQQQATLVPISQRKRVAASPERVPRENANVVHITPMPLHPGLNATAHGIPKNRDAAKYKRDGPCAGTKGYRAPEVLLRSLYQGVKLDIWSAGVSLLYLIVGKTPFQANSTDQAIKDIAKLRGKEEVWEIARIHDRESSLPEDLYSVEFENMTIEEWCKKNTKRPDFLDCIPPSLFDLINKCLCVNPRLRIDAEGALNHEFFAPCREASKKRRLLSRESVSTELSGPTASSAT